MLRLASQADRKLVASVHGEQLAARYRDIQRNLLREYLRAASMEGLEILAGQTRELAPQRLGYKAI